VDTATRAKWGNVTSLKTLRGKEAPDLDDIGQLQQFAKPTPFQVLYKFVQRMTGTHRGFVTVAETSGGKKASHCWV
jgi:hypothetical protein